MKEPLKLIQWADDGYPPIDLNENLSDVLALIREVKRLRLLAKDTEEPKFPEFPPKTPSRIKTPTLHENSR